MTKTVSVELTKQQCEEIASFVDWYLFETIRNDVETDNIEWVREMLDLYDKANKAYKEFEK